jgi:hypothetical protein
MTATKPSRLTTAALFCLTLALAGVPSWIASGCAPQVNRHGDTRIPAAYTGRTLSARLPAEIRVPEVIAAFTAVLDERGYSVQSSTVTEESGHIVAHAPRFDNYPRVNIRAMQATTATVVELTNEPFGDQEQCRSLLAAALAKLGL